MSLFASELIWQKGRNLLKRQYLIGSKDMGGVGPSRQGILWTFLRRDYQAMRDMYLSEPVPFDDVIATLRAVEQRINSRDASSEP